MKGHLNSCIRCHVSLFRDSGDHTRVISKKNYQVIWALCHWKVSDSKGGWGNKVLSSCAMGASSHHLMILG